jgi:beta-galactosidase
MISFSLSGKEVISFNNDWKFKLGDLEGAESMDFDDFDWEIINIPHDWAISGPFDHNLPANTGKLPWKGVGWYRKYFEIDDSDKANQIYFIFDGIMAFPEIYINGKLAGKWDYGYNSFFLNVTNLINFGETNLIAIKADTRAHDSRWYPGAGIFRKIQMLITDPIHVDVWGTCVRIPVIHDTGVILHIFTEIINQLDENTTITLESEIYDPDGILVANDIKRFETDHKNRITNDQWITLGDYTRWDVDSPDLYQLKTILKKNEKICDIVYTNFGIRTFLFTADDGFYLNGRRVQLKGVNLHHDHGPLGAKFYKRAMERQLEIMKAMGCNAIRNSHNIAAPELLHLCDSMGILVVNEVFDKWDKKAGYLREMDFDEFAERNIRNFIKRDRNHPCVVLWSVGNEIGEIQFNIDGGFEKLNKMVTYVRKYDPTRPVTLVCDAKNSAKWRHFDYYDIHAWNYGRRYLPAHLIDTTKPVVISESASTLSTRGFYELPLPEKKTDFTMSLQVSSYDLNAPWWAEVADDDFMWQQQDKYVSGEFVWTGFDYLGEPTPYNDEAVKDGWITNEQSANSSYFGIVDMCGIKKDRYYLYKSYWLPEEVTVHILPHWNWAGKEGENVPVFVYTNGDCAELFLNGVSLGKRCKKPDSENSIERFRLMWLDVIYQPGELKVVAYKNDKKVGEAVKTTSGKTYELKLTPDQTIINADGTDLSYILVEAIDKKGNLCPLADNMVEFEVDGPAKIEGVGNGNPQSTEPFVADYRKLFYGKAMLIIRSLNNKSGEIHVTAKAKGLKRGEVIVKSE